MYTTFTKLTEAVMEAEKAHPVNLSDERQENIFRQVEDVRFKLLMLVLDEVAKVDKKTYGLLVAVAFFVFEGLEMEAKERRERLVVRFREVCGEMASNLKFEAWRLVEEFYLETERRTAEAQRLTQEAKREAKRKERTAKKKGCMILLGKRFHATLRTARERQELESAYADLIRREFASEAISHGTRTFIAGNLVDRVFPWLSSDEDKATLANLIIGEAKKAGYRFPKPIWDKLVAAKAATSNAVERFNARTAKSRRKRDKRMPRTAQAEIKPRKSGNGGNGSPTAHGTIADQLKRAMAANKLIPEDGFVASEKGKRFYPATQADRLKQENLITFKSEEEAREAGYTPAAGIA